MKTKVFAVAQIPLENHLKTKLKQLKMIQKYQNTTDFALKTNGFPDAKSGTLKTFKNAVKTKVFAVAEIPLENPLKTKLKTVEMDQKYQNTTDFALKTNGFLMPNWVP